MNTTQITQAAALTLSDLNEKIKVRSDKMINFFLFGYFLIGMALAHFYDTYEIALVIGGLNLFAFYTTKLLLPKSDLYQYVLAGAMGIFMAQYIFQMHGLFEMHFIAFISSAILITYQKWKLQLPLTLVVLLHHSLFAYLQFSGNDQIYFTQLNYMDLQTFIMHITLAATIFFISGLWAYQLQKTTRNLIHQTNEITKLQNVEIQKAVLQQANIELDKFVYCVSHDLRAPLSSMQGVIEITEEETSDEVILLNLTLLKNSITKLDDFIQDLLEYSKNSRAEIKKSIVNMKEVLEEITCNLKYMKGGNNNKVEIRYIINDNAVCISDKSRINILLNNLISNAIRYQNPNTIQPFVEVKVDLSDTETGIVVRDNGVGISKENQQKIFDMFFRVSDNSTGTGLGLYIVKEIIDKLEGKIEVASEEGIGTTFAIKLPNNKLVLEN